jgi:hypothetical protein
MQITKCFNGEIMRKYSHSSLRDAALAALWTAIIGGVLWIALLIVWVVVLDSAGISPWGVK